MRRLTLLSFALLFAACAFAAEPVFHEPILLTSCGQSADVLMLKTLMAKDSLNFDYKPDAKSADLDGKGSLIVVVGGSSKGLGAAKISAEDETARISALLEAAHTAGIPVLAVHMGGMNRRGALSDPFNRLGAENAVKIIVVKGGDNDGFFTKLATEKKIPLISCANGLEVGPVVRGLYRTEAGK
jgi:hypothetical protein